MLDDHHHCRQSETPAISVVIPSYQRTTQLLDTLRDLATQEIDRLECIVVLQTRPSNEELRAMKSTLADNLRVFFVDEANASLARNIGLMQAKSDIVLFLDDDVRIENRHFLEKHLENFKDTDLPGVYGQVLERGQEPAFAPDRRIGEAANGWMYLPANYGHPCRTRSGTSNNLAVRRAWAIAVGGMDANFSGGALREETEFNLRYTRRYGLLAFDPDVSLLHLSGEGGSRAWGHVRRTVPMHHIVGRWYFLIASLCNGVLTPKGAVLELRSIGVGLIRNPRTGWSIPALMWNILRALYGLILAMFLRMRGPRYIKSIDPGSYELIA
jgi:glycosyltransferase involved in cell wall biosynthesis